MSKYYKLFSRIFSLKYLSENFTRIPSIFMLRLIFLPAFKFQFFLFKFFKISNKNIDILLSLKNKHKDQTIYIIGNGPSLSVKDLDFLKNEITFGSNKIYLIFKDTDWRPTYYSVEDDLVLKNNLNDINNYDDSLKLFPIHAIFDAGKIKNANYFNFHRHHYYPELPNLSNDLIKGIFWGGSIVYTQIQLAIYMGAKKIILLGVDFSFDVPKNYIDSSKEIISDGEINHFSKEYRKPGEKWNQPNLALQEKGYEKIMISKNKLGIEIYNATKNSKLNIIPKISLETVLDE